MSRFEQGIIRKAAQAFLLAVFALGIAAAPAAAAPSFGLELKDDTASFPGFNHSDQRVDYTLSVKNNAAAVSGAPSVGDKLFCNGAPAPLGSDNGWQGLDEGVNYTYEFRWMRNGAPLTAWTPGAPGRTYTLQAGDAEGAVQCLVKGTNGAKSGSFVAASLPAVVVNPQPAVEPPEPINPQVFERRPAIAGSAKNAGEELTCTAPTVWSGSPTWSFEWLRNGVPASAGTVTETTATTSKFKIAASELLSKAVFQCLAKASNAGGGALVESFGVKTEAPAPEFGPSFGTVGREDQAPALFPAAAFAPVVERADNTVVESPTLELELPGGGGTFAYQVKGTVDGQLVSGGEVTEIGDWSCVKAPPLGSQHAKVSCTSTRILKPGESYTPLKVTTALGPDTPDTAVAIATISGGGSSAPVSVQDSFSILPALRFGLTKFEAALFDKDGHVVKQAGAHPLSGAAYFALAMKRKLVIEGESPLTSAKFAPVGHARRIFADLPRGQVGNQQATPVLCPTVADVIARTCPEKSAVGVVNLVLSNVGNLGDRGLESTIYAIEHEKGTPAQFAFLEPAKNPITLTARLRPEDGYAVTVESRVGTIIDFLEATATLCDYGVKDGKYALKEGHLSFNGCREAGEPGSNPIPLFTNPSRCSGQAPVVTTRLESYEEQGVIKSFGTTTPPLEGCEESKVKFEPSSTLKPSSNQADSPTGLDIDLSMPNDNGLVTQTGIAQANLKKARIVFPQGMSVNASAGQGLGSCSAQQVGILPKGGKLVPNDDPVSCPESSKVGTIEIDTPILEKTLKGVVYVAKQGDVEGSLLGLYLVFESAEDGLLIKLPSKVTPDPKTGQLIATVDESPEAPFSAVHMHFPGGPRATLQTPPRCGHYEITTELVPWTAADPDAANEAKAVTQTSGFEVTQGPNGGPCPNGGLDPKLSAGTESPVAGKTSPFVLRLTREDGTDRFTALNLTTPPGLTAYLKGIPYCPDGVLNSISSLEGTGQAQIDHPSCPAASQIGTAIAGAGAGSNPLFVNTGKAYLAGPYKGAPLSLALVTPAVAGPLDLGNVVVRTALYLNPETAQITAVSDPIPTILHGILLDIRDIRVMVDRANFILNPTDCEALSIDASVKGQSGGSANLQNRFQVGGCENLAFGPKLSIELSGGTKRGGHPALKGIVQARPGEANIDGASVTIPRSEFLDQAHIRTICTRVQFAAKACPEGSIYGHATATTPLLDYPVEGPVYLRSSDHKLPDLVVALHGPDYQPIEAVVVGRVDSVKGQIRNTFEAAPDVPITKFVLSMRGGKKGLLVNSRDTCATVNRATVELEGHNGMRFDTRPAVRNVKCGAGRKGKRHRPTGRQRS